MRDGDVPVDHPDQDGRTALHVACAIGNSIVVAFILNCGADKKLPDAAHTTPLHLTCTAGATTRAHCANQAPDEAARVEIVHRLLAAGAPIDDRDSAGLTALMLAAVHGRTLLVTALLDAGADPAAKAGRGVTPLSLACARGQAAAVKVLLEAGAMPMASAPGAPSPLRQCCLSWAKVSRSKFSPRSAFHSAYAEIAAALLAAGAPAAGEQQRKNAAPLVLVCSALIEPVEATVVLPIIHDLLARGAAIEGAPEDGRRRRPLHEAAAAGNVEVVQALVSAGAAVDATDADLRTPYGCALEARADPSAAAAARRPRIDATVDALLEVGAVRRERIETPHEDDTDELVFTKSARGVQQLSAATADALLARLCAPHQGPLASESANDARAFLQGYDRFLDAPTLLASVLGLAEKAVAAVGIGALVASVAFLEIWLELWPAAFAKAPPGKVKNALRTALVAAVAARPKRWCDDAPLEAPRFRALCDADVGGNGWLVPGLSSATADRITGGRYQALEELLEEALDKPHDDDDFHRHGAVGSDSARKALTAVTPAV